MVSLEKTMFFLPTKYKIVDSKVYVAYNLLVIPTDMNITNMTLKIPLPPLPYDTHIVIRRLASRWSEKDLDKGNFPAVTLVIFEGKVPIGQSELSIDLSLFKDKWAKDRRKNNGILIQYKKIRDENFVRENPPYLIVDTL